MSRKRILASVLASMSALATSMAHGKIEKSAFSGLSNGMVSSCFLGGGRNLDAKAISNLATLKKGIKTRLGVNATLLATYGLIEGYDRYEEDIKRYGEDIKGGLKKIFIRNTKEENSGDNYIDVAPEREVNESNNVNYIGKSEKSEMNNDEYNQNKIDNSVNNTRDENSGNAGIYRLEVNNTSFFVAFGKSIYENEDRIYALFSQDRNEIQKLIEEKKNDNTIQTTKKRNVGINPSSRKDPEFLKGINAIVGNYLHEQGARNLKDKADRNNVKSQKYIGNNDKKIKRMVGEFIASCIGKELGIKKFDDNFKDDILNCLPDSIKLFDIDTVAAEKQVVNGVSVFYTSDSHDYVNSNLDYNEIKDYYKKDNPFTKFRKNKYKL